MKQETKKIYAVCITGEGIFGKAGNAIELPPLPDVEMQTDIDDVVELGSMDTEAEIGFKAKITPRGWLALMGMPTSNNWRKMHGGIMDRKCGKSKKEKNRKKRRNQNE